MIKKFTVLLIFGLFLTSLNSNAQSKLTRISGIVRDSITKEPLPFVNVVFVGKNIGAVTDYRGQYSIVTQWGSDQLQASFVGYKSTVKKVISESNQKINFELQPIHFSK